MTDFYHQRLWQASDAPFNALKQYHLETIYTVGNGYMGLRGTFEEGYPDNIVSTLVHGLFNHAEGDLVPDLVNLPNPLHFTIHVDGEQFAMKPGNTGRLLGYQRTLDLKTATLSRAVTWRTSRETAVQITFERFASLAHEHLLVQQVKIRALNVACQIEISAGLDSGVSNEGTVHLANLAQGAVGQNGVFVTAQTNQSNYHVCVASSLLASAAFDTSLSNAKGLPAINGKLRLEPGQTITFTKYTAIHSSRQDQDPKAAAEATLHLASTEGYDALRAAHNLAWKNYWHDCDIEIKGDDMAQRAVRFCLYHVLIAAPQHDERASIGAKTLSGPGYKGHVFWDTEFFMLPMLVATQPKLARNLLMYRYNNLQGARNKAQKNGFAGAMFPWESTDTGEETTPQWSHPQPDGTRVRIWTGDTEQHITSVVAYAVLMYWQWTGDAEFFLNYGAEIVLDTALFWGSRAEYNAEKDRFELSMQIGPDEYHENINNSVFTNSLVRWHLRQALDLSKWLQNNYASHAERLLKDLGIDAERLNHWQAIVDKMFIPHSAEKGILEQFEGFFNLERIDLAAWQPRVANMDWVLGHAKTQKMMVIKQADVVMLMAVLPNEVGDAAAHRRNWDFYYPVVDHGSSLSPSTHTWMAARLGLAEEAYKLFYYALNIDLEDLKGNVRDGIHAAASGGVWQAIVFGMAGLSVDANGQLHTDAKLPDHWQSLRFKVWVQGQQHDIYLAGK
jgi:trehalose/maltose hydrolase-like predicted phosphorylase